MGPARIAAVVVGTLLALAGLAAIAGGSTLVWAHATQRDAAGYYTTATEPLATTGYALTADADLGAQPRAGDWVPAHPLGTVRIQAVAPAGEPVFVGIAPQADVDRWLAGVAHAHVSGLSVGPFVAHTTQVVGSLAPVPPAAETFWAASTSGPGLQTVRWSTVGGRWAIVVMNASAAPGVAVSVTAGVRTGVLLPIGVGLLTGGLLIVALGALLIVVGLNQATPRPPETAAAAPVPAAPAHPGAYPIRLEGRLDPAVGRWLWLVKWALLLPHAIVLAGLWLAAGLLTVVAGLAILVTGRYPRSIFTFNVGVLRWTWRVSFYAIGAFGTDRYPPFSLSPDPTYPADLAVDYPEHLSRGLVLVKWWLLAIPHYVIVAIFLGGFELGRAQTWGLIPVLALIGAVTLALRGGYPTTVFDFVMGLNRWCYRVLAYATLLRDEYPPFRLDGGGLDPAGAVSTRPAGP